MYTIAEIDSAQIEHLMKMNRLAIEVIKPSGAMNTMEGYLFVMLERQHQLIEYLLAENEARKGGK